MSKGKEDFIADVVCGITGGSVYMWVGDIIKSFIVGFSVGVALYFFRKMRFKKDKNS